MSPNIERNSDLELIQSQLSKAIQRHQIILIHLRKTPNETLREELSNIQAQILELGEKQKSIIKHLRETRCRQDDSISNGECKDGKENHIHNSSNNVTPITLTTTTATTIKSETVELKAVENEISIANEQQITVRNVCGQKQLATSSATNAVDTTSNSTPSPLSSVTLSPSSSSSHSSQCSISLLPAKSKLNQQQSLKAKSVDKDCNNATESNLINCKNKSDSSGSQSSSLLKCNYKTSGNSLLSTLQSASVNNNNQLKSSITLSAEANTAKALNQIKSNSTSIVSKLANDDNGIDVNEKSLSVSKFSEETSLKDEDDAKLAKTSKSLCSSSNNNKTEKSKPVDCKPKEHFLAALGLVTKEALTEIQSKKCERKRRTTANPQFSSAAIEAKRITALELAAKRATKIAANAAAAAAAALAGAVDPKEPAKKNNASHKFLQSRSNRRHQIQQRENNGNIANSNENNNANKNNNTVNSKDCNEIKARSNLNISNLVSTKVSNNCYVCDEHCDPNLDAVMFCKDCRCLFHATCVSNIDDISKTLTVPCPKCDQQKPLEEEVGQQQQIQNNRRTDESTTKEKSSKSTAVSKNKQVNNVNTKCLKEKTEIDRKRLEAQLNQRKEKRRKLKRRQSELNENLENEERLYKKLKKEEESKKLEQENLLNKRTQLTEKINRFKLIVDLVRQTSVLIEKNVKENEFKKSMNELTSAYQLKSCIDAVALEENKIVENKILSSSLPEKNISGGDVASSTAVNTNCVNENAINDNEPIKSVEENKLKINELDKNCKLIVKAEETNDSDKTTNSLAEVILLAAVESGTNNVTSEPSEEKKFTKVEQLEDETSAAVRSIQGIGDILPDL